MTDILTADAPAEIESTTPTPQETARAAHLRYVSDHRPGITREAWNEGFRYRGPDGEIIDDPETLDRIRRLAIPPAYTRVWICPYPNGHMQATGYDVRGRKQYRYHERWRAVRDETKFERMLAFGEALPRIRAKVAADLQLRGLPREKILATVVRLLETTLIRIGNEEYAKENKSFGLTTLRNRHVQVDGTTLHFEFRAKSGKMRVLDLRDRTLARILGQLRDLPGQELFQYVEKDGTRHKVDSDDVNAYLREAAGADFTAKDFRTWAATVLAAYALQEVSGFDTKTAAKRNMTRAIEQVAGELGNTVAICRKCYIHPEIFAAYLDGSLIETLQQEVAQDLADPHSLTPQEKSVLSFLGQRLAREVEKRRSGKRKKAA